MSPRITARALYIGRERIRHFGEPSRYLIREAIPERHIRLGYLGDAGAEMMAVLISVRDFK